MEATRAARGLDLRGERCPYTFIKTRLALEEMAAGEVLEVWLDFAPAYVRVPASLAVLGHEVVKTWPEGGGMKLLVRCTGEDEVRDDNSLKKIN